MMLPCEMVQKLWVHARLFFTSTTGFSLNITTFALTSAYSTLPLPLTTPIITTMQVPRLLDIQFKTEDSDYHGHRTHTSVLSLSMSLRRLLTFRIASRCKHTTCLSTTELGYVPINYGPLQGCQFRFLVDDTTTEPRRFLIPVDATLKSLLSREDTDQNVQITIDDSGPKVLSLGTESSHGLKHYDIRGNYSMIAPSGHQRNIFSLGVHSIALLPSKKSHC